jgi:hypothetical protein
LIYLLKNLIFHSSVSLPEGSLWAIGLWDLSYFAPRQIAENVLPKKPVLLRLVVARKHEISLLQEPLMMSIMSVANGVRPCFCMSKPWILQLGNKCQGISAAVSGPKVNTVNVDVSGV